MFHTGPLPSACACEWMLHTGYYISSVAWRYQVWQSVNEASSFINSTGRAVTNALRSTSCKDSKDEDEEVQVLLQCLENYATVPTNEKNTTSTEMELLRAWIGAVACEVGCAPRNMVIFGSILSMKLLSCSKHVVLQCHRVLCLRRADKSIRGRCFQQPHLALSLPCQQLTGHKALRYPAFSLGFFLLH